MDELDAAIALVYAQPPNNFVSARAALVKELKAAKRKDEAARVAAVRRPTKLAWAVGEAVRRAPEAAEAYFDAIAGLAAPDADLRGRTADLRTAVSALVPGAEGVEAGEATAALLATAADPEAALALRLGRLAEVPVGGGFGGLAFGLEASAEPKPPAPEAVPGGGVEGAAGGSEDDGEADRAEADAQAEAEARERQEREAQARAERLEALEAERDQAVSAEEAAARRVEAAEAALQQAQADVDLAKGALEVAREAAAAATARLSEARE